MADYTFPSTTTAVVGLSSTIRFQVQTKDPYTVEVSNGTISLGNVNAVDFGILTGTESGWLRGRRPTQGQLFPRGVYNK